MAVSIALRPAVKAPVLILTFLTALILHRSVADSHAGAPASEEPPHRRFEYKYSFKGPHLSQTDGSIPFWIHTGSKFVSSCQHHRAAGRLLFQLNTRANQGGRARSRFRCVTGSFSAQEVKKWQRFASSIQNCTWEFIHFSTIALRWRCSHIQTSPSLI